MPVPPPQPDTPQPSPTRLIALLGFMGSGKSTVGAVLAESLGWRFADLDALIESAAARSIPEIFTAEGEPSFRDREHLALQTVLAESAATPTVLALGGGAFVPERNRQLLQDGNTLTVFLELPVEQLWRRCREAQVVRPLARDFNSFQSLYAERLPVYQQARLQLPTAGKLPNELAGAIRDWLHHR